jgi:hypothetical protein
MRTLVSGFEVDRHPDPHHLIITLCDPFRGACVHTTGLRWMA